MLEYALSGTQSWIHSKHSKLLTVWWLFSYKCYIQHFDNVGFVYITTDRMCVFNLKNNYESIRTENERNITLAHHFCDFSAVMDNWNHFWLFTGIKYVIVTPPASRSQWFVYWLFTIRLTAEWTSIETYVCPNWPCSETKKFMTI